MHSSIQYNGSKTLQIAALSGRMMAWHKRFDHNNCSWGFCFSGCFCSPWYWEQTKTFQYVYITDWSLQLFVYIPKGSLIVIACIVNSMSSRTLITGWGLYYSIGYTSRISAGRLLSIWEWAHVLLKLISSPHLTLLFLPSNLIISSWIHGFKVHVTVAPPPPHHKPLLNYILAQTVLQGCRRYFTVKTDT